MKPILFPANTTTFTTNGLGHLDPTRCVVVEERNGQYELECELAVDSAHYSDIANNMILAVASGDGMSVHGAAEIQGFRIYRISEPLNGIVTLSARHVSYDLSYNTVMPFTAPNISTAFSGIASHAVEDFNFTLNTDKTTSARFAVKTPQSIRAILGGQAGSILDVYGGEYEWNNFVVNLWNQRGTDTNVTLRYGKNITDINQEQNLENVVTGIVPYWANEEQTVTLTEKSVDSQYASQYPFKRTIPIDFSSDWENPPTESQLRTRAQNYITANRIGIPKVSIKVSFVSLWQTEEYKDIAPLERVHLCDTVGVIFDKYGINTRAEVVKTEWDCLAERYLSIELGEARSNMASTIVSMDQEQTQAIKTTKSTLQTAIDSATAAINGVNGGYLVIQSDASGHPYRMLIMDQPTTSAARVVWQYNQNGWGVSTNGIGGPYTLAATIDPTYGAILNASFIRAGTMVADRILGGIFQSKDNDHKFYVDMDTGDANISDATLRNVDIEGIAGVNINLGATGLAFLRKSDRDIIGYVTALAANNKKLISILSDGELDIESTDTTKVTGTSKLELSSPGGTNTSGRVDISANGQMNLDGEEVNISGDLSVYIASEANTAISGDTILESAYQMDFDIDEDFMISAHRLRVTNNGTGDNGYGKTGTYTDSSGRVLQFVHGILVDVS